MRTSSRNFLPFVSAFAALLVTTANAEASAWKLFLIGESGSVHLQTYTELPYADDPIHFDSKVGCIKLGIDLVQAKRDVPRNTIIGFYCEEVTLGQKPDVQPKYSPKFTKLVCVDPDNVGRMEIASDLAKSYSDSVPDMTKEYQEIAEYCESADFSMKSILVFDPKDLEKDEGVAEYTGVYACGLNVDPTTKVRMTHTVSEINFHSLQGGINNPLRFNVGRKTLGAGFGTDRSWTCHIEEIDVSQNKI